VETLPTKIDRLKLFSSDDMATPEIYPLSLHDALPICAGGEAVRTYTLYRKDTGEIVGHYTGSKRHLPANVPEGCAAVVGRYEPRSEEHTSELQSREKLVCRLLLEKKKNN